MNNEATANSSGDEAQAQTSEEATANTEPTKAEQSSNDSSSAQPEASQASEYTLSLPEDSPLGEDAVADLNSYAKSQGLSKEQATSLLERENANAVAKAEAESAGLDQKAEEWRAKIMTDKEIGGEKYVDSLKLSKRVVDTFGSDELKKVLGEGLGDHPELVRTFVRIGRAMSDDTFEHAGTPPATEKSMEESFYGGAKEKE